MLQRKYTEGREVSSGTVPWEDGTLGRNHVVGARRDTVKRQGKVSFYENS